MCVAWIVAAWLSGLGGCSNQYNPPARGAMPTASRLGSKRAVTIDSTPSSALIYVNGMVKGAAPIEIQVDVDDLGDIAVDVELTANFADSFSGSKGAASAVVNYTIARGDRVPTVVRFDTDSATVQ